MMAWQQLYTEHIKIRQRCMEDLFSHAKLNGLVLSSGDASYFYEDDQTQVFRSSANFSHWVPLVGENHFLVISPETKPKLYYYQPADFWYEHQGIGKTFWSDEFDIEVSSDKDHFWKTFSVKSRTWFHGPNAEKAKDQGYITGQPEWVSWLSWHRALKTGYELECIKKATEIAARGHLAAKNGFIEGLSERQIHYRYLQSTEMLERELPYENIIALNEKGAILHYAQKRLQPTHGQVLLIDAGALKNGYASDITRTYASSDAHPIFQELVVRLNQAQLELCAKVRCGLQFDQLNMEAHCQIARILLDLGILVGLEADGAVAEELTRPFFPHGLGHFLGLFVHDVGGSLGSELGEQAEASKLFPKLRLTRPLREGMVLTIEPGIYFIPMLLEPLETGAKAKYFSWKLIHELIPFGGVRIEDNLCVGKNQSINLTRKYLP